MKTIVYTPQIPTGVARTRGHGTTREVYVLRVGDGFKSRNSPHEELRYFGRIRTDYGMKRGHARRVLDEARAFCAMCQLPDERTTREEF